MTNISPHPFLNINYETALESLGDDYFDPVEAAEFPHHVLRFRNNQLLPLLGLEPAQVSNGDFIEAFGKFQGERTPLALRYHGYQFGTYNPFLGDGRGFLYGQVRGTDGYLYDFGTKGSGTTPYSRQADGRLTLKGGVREVLAGEALYNLGVNTSRCLSLIETGERLWRSDEPSPTRSSVMVRFSRSHIRFGTFERLHYIKRPDLIKKLLDHVIDYYYPEIRDLDQRYAQFYAALVERVAKLVAQWMAAGFCHGVLNTDNMSISGESFDYGPYAFIPTYNPQFVAAYFDYGGRYSYGNQPYICKLNLEMLQVPLAMVVDLLDLEAGLAGFEDYYQSTYRQLMIQKLGLTTQLPVADAEELVNETILLLSKSGIGYHDFFAQLAEQFNYAWFSDSTTILENTPVPDVTWQKWQNLYHLCLQKLPQQQRETMGDRLKHHNPKTVLLRPVIESVWEPITLEDDWQPFYQLVTKLQNKQ